MCNMSLERHQNQFPLIVWCDCTSAETRRFNSVYRNRNTIKAPHGCLHLISICVWQSRWKLESHWTHLCCILLLLLCFSWDRMQLQSDLILFRSVFTEQHPCVSLATHSFQLHREIKRHAIAFVSVCCDSARSVKNIVWEYSDNSTL